MTFVDKPDNINTMFITIFFLIFALILFFWQVSLIVSIIAGVPTVHSKKEVVIKAYELAQLKKGETVVDLGSGSGNSLIIASKKFKARGVGVEISPFYFLLSKLRVFLSGESKNVKIIFGRFQRAGQYLKSADVVYLYLFDKITDKIDRWLFDSIGEKTKVVSFGFKFTKRKALSTKTDPALYLYRK